MSDEVLDAPEVVAPVAPAPAAAAPVAQPAANAEAQPAAAPPSDEPAPVASKWSDTWREDMAGALPETATAEEKAEHAKLLNRLKRLNTPADVAKAIREQDKLISSGELKRALPKNATPAQIAEYRKSHGIPETPDKYEIRAPAGVELNELDKKMLDGWAAKAHATNATPEQMKAGVDAYFETRQAIADQMAEANAAAKRDTIEVLRAEWGTDYLPNTNGVSSMLGQWDTDAREALMSATLPDGTQVMNSPGVIRALAAQARQLGYTGATVLPAGADLGKSVEDEIASIEKSMFNEDGTKSPAYWNSQKAQDRYSELLATKQRISK